MDGWTTIVGWTALVCEMLLHAHQDDFHMLYLQYMTQKWKLFLGIQTCQTGHQHKSHQGIMVNFLTLNIHHLYLIFLFQGV